MAPSAPPTDPTDPTDPLERERLIWNKEADAQIEQGLAIPYRDWGEWVASKRHYAAFDSFVRENPLKDESVLQLGGGNLFHVLLPSIGYSRFVIGDRADRALVLARQRAELCGAAGERQFVHLDAHAMPLADDSIGLVIANAVLHHLDRPRFVPELARVLKKGGRAVFIDPMLEGPLRVTLAARAFRKADRGTDDPLRASDIALLRRNFARVEVVRMGFLSDLILTSLLGGVTRSRERRVRIGNRLEMLDEKLNAVPGYGAYLCNLAILLVEK